MDKEIKKQWVDALRSGKYKQGRAQLRIDIDGDLRFCCLGILCEVVSANYDGEDEYLPVAVQRAAGLDEDPGVQYKGAAAFLSVLNDDEKLTFLEIADIIEEQL